MSEYTFVEQPILGWLCGEPKTKYGARSLGWTYRDEAAMALYERPLEDPLVDKLLVPAILRINAAVRTDAQAKLAVEALRKTMSHPDKLTANRQTLDLLRDGARVVLEPGADAKTVQFIEFHPGRQNRNDFTATNQYRVQGVKQCREDMVLLVNGIPLVIAEYKSYVASGKDWREAVHQLHRYQRQAPAVLTPNLFCVAADEDEFRYGTVLFHDASKDDVERHLDAWGRWLSLYRNGTVSGTSRRRPIPTIHWRCRCGVCSGWSPRTCSTSSGTSSSSRPSSARRPRKSRATSSSKR
jgi:type I restriction enzyme, R subunit